MSNANLQKEIRHLEKEENDTEAWLLACIMYDNGCLSGLEGQPGILGMIEPDHFGETYYANIYKAMLSLNEQGIHIDNTTTYNEMERLGYLIGGDHIALTKILMRVIGPDSTLYNYQRQYYGFARVVLGNWKERELRAVSGEIATASHEQDTEKLETLQSKLDQIVHVGSKDGQGMLVKNDGHLEQQVEAWHDDPQDIRGYRTGIERLDWYLGGLIEDELIVLAGYTGSGKSTLAMQIALKFCEQGTGLIIPTEMSVDQWKLRLAAFLLGTDDKSIRQGKYRDKERLKSAIRYVNELPVEWFEGSAPTPIQILTSARNLRRNRLIEWIIVDGMHDIKAEGEIYERTVATVDCLHAIAGMGLRVLTTAHLNRGATDEPNPRDLLGAARIEQAATRILTLYRPGNLLESGELKSLPNGMNANSAQVRLAKSRFSEAGGLVKLFFGKRNGQHGFFPEVDDIAPPDYRSKED